MNAKVMSLSLGLAAIAGAHSPVYAGEWSSKGIADYNRSVAVPAPMPVPVNKAQWYLRGDFGIAASADGTLDVTGFPVETFGFDADRPFSYSFGVGRYFDHSNLRWDISVDYRDYQRVTGHNEPITGLHVITAGTNGGSGLAQTEDRTFNGDFHQSGEAQSTTALLSLYYDLDTGTAFTPYFGGGIGLAVHELKIKSSSDLACSNLDITATPPDLDVLGQLCTSDEIHTKDSTTARGYGVAAAATAGLAYEVMEGISIDVAYRFLWQGGNVAVTAASPSGTTTIDIGDRIDHEIRTGVRFDIF